MNCAEIRELKRIRSKVTDFCKAHPKMFIYGAGKIAESWFQFLHDMGITPHGIIVTEHTSENFHGIPVYIASAIYEQLDEQCGVIAGFSGANELMLRELIGEKAGVLALRDDLFCALVDSKRAISFLRQFKSDKRRGSLQKPQQWKHILVIRLDVLGDLIMTTAFLRELHRNCLNAEITLVVHRKNQFVFNECPYLTDLLLYDGSIMEGYLDDQFRQRNEIEEDLKTFSEKYWKGGKHYDVVFLPSTLLAGRNTLASFLLAQTSPSDCLVGRVNSYRMDERLRYPYLKKICSQISYETEEKHEVQYMLDMLKCCGCTIRDDSLELWIDENSRLFAERMIPQTWQQVPVIAIGLVGSHPARNWPPANYQKLIREICNRFSSDAKFILIGGEDAELVAEYIVSRAEDVMDSILNLAGKTSLSEAMALMERCSFYIGSDTGLMHMAAALNVTVVELSIALPDCPKSNGSHPHRMGPWKNDAIILHPQKAKGTCMEICRERHPHCIAQISVDDVVDAIMKAENAYGY